MWQHLHYRGSATPYGCWEFMSSVNAVRFISFTLSRANCTDNGSHPWLFFVLHLLAIFFPITPQRAPQTLGTERQMLCLAAAKWIIQRKHLDLVLFIKKRAATFSWRVLGTILRCTPPKAARGDLMGRGKLSSQDHRSSSSLHLAMAYGTRISIHRSMPAGGLLRSTEAFAMRRSYQKVSLKLSLRFTLTSLPRDPTRPASAISQSKHILIAHSKL